MIDYQVMGDNRLSLVLTEAEAQQLEALIGPTTSGDDNLHMLYYRLYEDYFPNPYRFDKDRMRIVREEQ